MDYCPSRNLPWDDEPDTISEAERFLQEYDELEPNQQNLYWAKTIIQYLLDTMEEEGIT